MDGLLFGEVVRGYAPEDDFNHNKFRWEYTVRAVSSGGSVGLYHHAILVEMHSGFDDYHERILRTSFENNSKASAYSFNPQEIERSSGDRCIIGFIGSDERKPVILGFLPPNLNLPTENFTNSLNQPLLGQAGGKPQLRGRYNGLNYHIDDLGQLRIQHTGAPELLYANGLYTSTVPESEDSTTTFDMLQGGLVRLVDSLGQAFVMNSDDGYISINNTTITPLGNATGVPETIVIQETGVGDPIGQEIRLDLENNLIRILSSGNLETTVTEDVVLDITGNLEEIVGATHELTVTGDATYTYQANLTTGIAENFEESIGADHTFTVSGEATQDYEANLAVTVGGNLAETISGNCEQTITGNYTQDISGDYAQSITGTTAYVSTGGWSSKDATGAGFKVESGKIALGSSAVELVDQTIQIIDQFLTVVPLGISSVGPVTINPALATALTTIKTALTTIKGSL